MVAMDNTIATPNPIPSVINVTDRSQLPLSSGVYAALVNGIAMYVGQSTNLYNRWRTHPTLADCREHASADNSVEIAYWLMPEELLAECERRVLHSAHIPWSRDSIELVFGDCGELIGDSRNIFGLRDAHYRECDKCKAFGRLRSKAGDLTRSIHPLMTAMQESGLWFFPQRIDARNAMEMFALAFAANGQKVVEYYVELARQLSEAEDKHRRHRQEAVSKYLQCHGLTVEAISSILKTAANEFYRRHSHRLE